MVVRREYLILPVHSHCFTPNLPTVCSLKVYSPANRKWSHQGCPNLPKALSLCKDIWRMRIVMQSNGWPVLGWLCVRNISQVHSHCFTPSLLTVFLYRDVSLLSRDLKNENTLAVETLTRSCMVVRPEYITSTFPLFYPKSPNSYLLIKRFEEW